MKVPGGNPSGAYLSNDYAICMTIQGKTPNGCRQYLGGKFRDVCK